MNFSIILMNYLLLKNMILFYGGLQIKTNTQYYTKWQWNIFLYLLLLYHQKGLFSDAKNLVTSQRTCLDSFLINQFMFLKRNRDYVDIFGMEAEWKIHFFLAIFIYLAINIFFDKFILIFFTYGICAKKIRFWEFFNQKLDFIVF